MTNDSQLMTVLVTGGAGFIGSHLCERLLSLSDSGPRTSDLEPSVICLDNFTDFYDPDIKEQNISQITDHPDFTLIHGDILDTDLLERVFSGQSFKRNERNKRNKRFNATQRNEPYKPNAPNHQIQNTMVDPEHEPDKPKLYPDHQARG